MTGITFRDDSGIIIHICRQEDLLFFNAGNSLDRYVIEFHFRNENKVAIGVEYNNKENFETNLDKLDLWLSEWYGKSDKR